ncbi:hypothetical protein BOTBODRAFT_163340 [Botryobasidium botryosum FD-172 SS1]|uniref:Uncharacterized protein n=1 Tax=Botryobasidium botryosum (strain FD-172 SS1) TaxID=930990 RepID=A0A067MHJ1_BOTB1|nr:hypothetical protein BOTBODRAFT_163340 [Botryobasidium botryosum FD-172 SS1]
MAAVSFFLEPTDADVPHNTLYHLVIATIRCFKPSRLTGPIRRAGRVQEKAYDVEFYRSLHRLVNGNVIITPEFASATDAPRTGRIDFFVHRKKWGIECTREGDRLEQHSSRFGNGGAYGAWLRSGDMADYILLDFRTSKPTKAHPNCTNLYHVVFQKNCTEVVILDNELEEKKTIGLLGKTL